MRLGGVRCLLGFAVLTVLVFGAVGSVPHPAVAAQSDLSTETTIRIVLNTDGAADWRVTMRFSLQTENDSDAFDRLSDEYMAGGTDVLDAAPFRDAAGLAAASTGREMEITRLSRSADRDAEQGRLVLSFTWTNFTLVSGERIELGDVFRSESGTWFPTLATGQELIIEFPRGYAVRSSSRPLRNGSFHVEGPTTFDPGEPSATLERTGVVGTTSVPPTTSPPAGGFGFTSALGVGTVLVFLVAIGYLVVRRSRETPDSPGPVSMNEADEASGTPVAESTDTTDEPLLSDEERVKRLLRQNGGRMKQVDIVEETDWSNAKVSQLLTEMADQGEVDKLRIGRENLISLPGERPDELK